MSKEWLKQPCFIQSFAPSSLVHIHNKTDLPKIFLIDDVDVRTQDTNQVNNRIEPDFFRTVYFEIEPWTGFSGFRFQTYQEITSDRYFNYIKEFVVGIGPWKDTIVTVKDNYIQSATDLVARAHENNLQVLDF